MSAVVYDVGYDIRMIKTRKNMVSVRLLAAIKNTTSQDIDCLKNIKNIVTYVIPYTDNLISDHGIKPFLESFLSAYI